MLHSNNTTLMYTTTYCQFGM